MRTSSTVQGLLTLPPTLKSLVPLLLSRPNDPNLCSSVTASEPVDCLRANKKTQLDALRVRAQAFDRSIHLSLLLG